MLFIFLVATACAGNGDDDHASPTTSNGAVTHEETVDELNLVCIETNRQISALPSPDPNDAAEFRQNFAEIVRLNRAGLERMKRVESAPADRAAMADILEKQEVAVGRLETMGQAVAAGGAVPEEERAALRNAIDAAADALDAFGATACGRQ